MFPFYHHIQTYSGARPASYLVGTGGGALTPEIKWPEHEADDSPLSSAEVKNTYLHSLICLSGIVPNEAREVF
jgi:hypothetical protein